MVSKSRRGGRGIQCRLSGKMAHNRRKTAVNESSEESGDINKLVSHPSMLLRGKSVLVTISRSNHSAPLQDVLSQVRPVLILISLYFFTGDGFDSYPLFSPVISGSKLS